MEEGSNNIRQTNDENRHQSSNQNVCCNICARTFGTNRGLLQHLNFYRQRNRHEGDKPTPVFNIVIAGYFQWYTCLIFK